MAKNKDFDIDRFMAVLENEYLQWDAPSVTLISNSGATPFEVLVSTVLSARTKDEVTIVASRRLFQRTRTPMGMLELDEKTIGELIYPVGFYHTKAARLRAISRMLLENFGGEVPESIPELLTLPGVGRKTANLVMVEGFGKDAICVDTHVHRISNRVGYINTPNPEKTEFELRKKLPRKHWIKYNEILVAFGQVICRPISPFCSRCPVSVLCNRIGVEHSR